MLKKLSAGFILLFIFCFAANATLLASDQVKMDNKDFSFMIPSSTQFIQKKEIISGSSSAVSADTYFYETAAQAANASAMAQNNSFPVDNFIYVIVSPFTKVFTTEAARVKSQRAFIAFLVGSNQLGFTVPPKGYYENIEKNITDITLNGQLFQTYTLVLPNKTISYYAIIINNRMYSFQGFFFNASKSSFNDELLKESLKTLLIK
jgi:hypothetical protein